MALSNLMFAWIAIAGPKEWLFAQLLSSTTSQQHFERSLRQFLDRTHWTSFFGNPICLTGLDRKPWKDTWQVVVVGS